MYTYIHVYIYIYSLVVDLRGHLVGAQLMEGL